MQEGLILKGISGFYYVKSGNSLLECKPRGIFRKTDFIPLAGDKVNITLNDYDISTGVIEEILPRKNSLVRPPVSNIDQVIIVASVKNPSPDLMLLDKLLIKAKEIDIDTVICINKIDLCEDSRNIFRTYERAGFKVIFVSAISGNGILELKETLTNKISILAGQSGVGKSTILNSLSGNASMKIGDLSNKINRGKHTTRHVELFEISENTYIADTPGFSSFEIEMLPEKLQIHYPDFFQYIGKCKYTGCMHISEPECEVKNALNEGNIEAGRYERYVQLINYLKSIVRYKK